jgi:fructokinase
MTHHLSITMKNVIVGLDEALWDVLPNGKKLGGAPANFAYHVAQFGLNSMAVSAIGNDKLGDGTLEALDEKRLKYYMQRIPYPTGSVQVTLDEEGVPCYDIKENVAWDNIVFTPDSQELSCCLLRAVGTAQHRLETDYRFVSRLYAQRQ